MDAGSFGSPAGVWPGNVSSKYFNMKKRIAGYKRISSLYSLYRIRMNDIWRTYNFNEFVFKYIRKKAKKEPEEFNLTYIDLIGENSHVFDRQEIFGIIDHLEKSTNKRRTFLEAVIATENFLKDISLCVYQDFPGKLTPEKDDIETENREYKLLKLILESEDKDEMIAKLTEEKIRSIFYGNPTDFFTKDPARIGIKKFFANNHHKTMEVFAEIIARRNVYVHNAGRVDRKYLREVQNSAFKIKQKAVIDDVYLRESLMILKALGLLAATAVIKETYGETPNVRMTKETKIVNKRFNS